MRRSAREDQNSSADAATNAPVNLAATPRSGWRRVRSYARILSIALIFAAPVWSTWHGNHVWSGLTKSGVRFDSGVVGAGSSDLRMASTGAADLSERAALYIATRAPHLAQLLPEGEGGTAYVEKLPNASGFAFARRASIAIAMRNDSPYRTELVEVHERAHLLHSAIPELAAALFAALRSPHDDGYAAKNNGEHFAEMASSAWELVHQSQDVCSAESPLEQLDILEERIPGTAGFVAYYLRHPVFTQRHDGASQYSTTEIRTIPWYETDALRAAAEIHIAPQREIWQQIWSTLDSRRMSDGTLQKWAVPTMSEWVRGEQVALRSEGGVINRVAAMSYLPGELILRLVGNNPGQLHQGNR